MIHVKLTFPGWPIERQTPNHSGVWENCRFFINEPVGRCDYWVVCEGLVKREKTTCPRENTILITCEPPTLKEYPQYFLDQFATVITCHPDIKHNNPIFQQPGLPWHIGRRQKNHVNLSFSKDYDELMSITRFNKDKEISVISSAKNDSVGHRQRVHFVKILKRRFGDKIDVFGRGIREIEDKWDALARYKYHVALENSSVEDYWTEKLSDAFLAGCYPIYYGSPNIDQYFSASALTRIDINHPEKAIQIIETCIKESRFEKAQEEIKKARSDILNRYNLFAMISAHVDNNQYDLAKAIYSKTSIFPESSSARRLALIKNSFRLIFNPHITMR